MFVLGIGMTIGIAIFLRSSYISANTTEASGISMTVTEYCVYKNKDRIQVSSFAIKEGASVYGKQCPPARRNSPLSYKMVIRTNTSSTKKLSVKFTYINSGIKTLYIASVPAVYTVSAPVASAYLSFYQFK